MVRDNIAYVAAYTGGFQVVDFSTPTSPQIAGGLTGRRPSGFVPRDVAVTGGLALAAEQLFPNVVAMVDITDPANPRLQDTLDLAPLGDYAGTGIALTQSYVYITEESFVVRRDFAASGNTRLFIGQYQSFDDTAGVPPTVRITSPVAGEEVMAGTTLRIIVEANDDVAVAAVDIRVNGQLAFTGTTAPYELEIPVPVGITDLTLAATAIDFGGNEGRAEDVTVDVVADEPPVVTITSPAEGDTFAEGNTITINVDARDDVALDVVVFTINGQVHYRMHPTFLRERVKFSAIAKHLVVVVECKDMDPEVAEYLFPTSRDRSRSSAKFDALKNQLEHILRDHKGLRELNARRRADQLKEILTDKEPLKVIQSLLNSDPALAQLLGIGNRLHNPFVPADDQAPFKGKRFPTFLRILKEPKKGLVKRCPINKTCRVEFETDAENAYFDREDSPGQITFSPPQVVRNFQLFNGRLSTVLAVPPGADIGKDIDVRVQLDDESRIESLECQFTLRVAQEAVPQLNRHTSNGSSRNKNRSQQLAMLTDILVTKDGRRIDGRPTKIWDDLEFDSDQHSAAVIEDNGEDGIDVYINMDNIHLLNQLQRETSPSDHPLFSDWYRYGMLLSALAMLQEERRRQKNAGESNGNSNGTLIPIASSGLASVIIPMIRRLHSGPAFR
ncbi:MAG: hypothetical protein IH899_02000 [Planctomycetes bacterium]|nr:hypothetical protein [Planctomycetota bacterium]